MWIVTSGSRLCRYTKSLTQTLLFGEIHFTFLLTIYRKARFDRALENQSESLGATDRYISMGLTMPRPLCNGRVIAAGIDPHQEVHDGEAQSSSGLGAAL